MTGLDSGCKVVTLSCSDWDDGLNALIGVQYTRDRSGCKKVTLFGSDCDGSLYAVMGVQYTGGRFGCEMDALVSERN